MRNKNFRLTMSLIINVIIIVLEIIGTAICTGGTGLEMFSFYTTDSNIFSLTVCIVFAFFTARSLFSSRKPDIPKLIRTLKYISVCCLNVTFVVVVTIFAPVFGEGGYEYMLFNGDFLYFHFSCPLLSLISFVLFEGGTKYDVGLSFAATIPTLIYAFVAVILNLLNIMEGPYPFLYVYEQPLHLSILWLILFTDIAFLSASLIQKLGSTVTGFSEKIKS